MGCLRTHRPTECLTHRRRPAMVAAAALESHLLSGWISLTKRFHSWPRLCLRSERQRRWGVTSSTPHIVTEVPTAVPLGPCRCYFYPLRPDSVPCRQGRRSTTFERAGDASAGDSILAFRLDAAIRALAPAAVAGTCVSARARELLWTFLAAQRRSLLSEDVHDADPRGSHNSRERTRSADTGRRVR